MESKEPGFFRGSGGLSERYFLINGVVNYNPYKWLKINWVTGVIITLLIGVK